MQLPKKLLFLNVLKQESLDFTIGPRQKIPAILLDQVLLETLVFPSIWIHQGKLPGPAYRVTQVPKLMDAEAP